ncbi:MAG: fluoride efflux transporter CrcB [Bacteroidaceae bacterium]|nr:fluoride efflux transporter CrcB [Bacteroidaceae bacterium]
MMMDIVKNIFIVGLGSFIGGGGRYFISMAMKGLSGGFPWGTLLVNLLGCFMIGLFAGYFNKDANVTLFLTYGICGGFTTFSTFSRESLIMLQGGNYWGVISYVAISVVVGIILTACGYMLAQ